MIPLFLILLVLFHAISFVKNVVMQGSVLFYSLLTATRGYPPRALHASYLVRLF